MASNTTQLTIQINGREVENTLNGIGRQVGQLSRELRDLNRNDPNFRQRQAELSRARELYSELRNEINNVGDASQNLNSSLNDFSRNILGNIGLVGGVAGLSVGVSELTRKAAELSDAQSNVMKTTQMTKEEVDELTDSFDNLNTRTSKLDLLKIAEEGGRLGLPIDEIEDFVLWMDKSVVALGDSFTGGVEEIASSLGKIKMMFKETKDMNVGEAYNQIGSAINELGANGVATEKNIAEFATRVGSLPNVLKPSIAEALALGAAFEESGIDAEVASRAYSIVLQRASSNTEEFAKVMQLPVEQVRAMINANPLEFFLQFAEKLKGINPEATEMANILGNLKINADGANKVMGAASNNTDRFRESIALSNKAMADGTSLTDEFNTKNNNLAAIIEKIQKRFYELGTDPTLIKFITTIADSFAILIGAVDDSEKKTTIYQKALIVTTKVIIILISTLAAYNGSLALTALWKDKVWKRTVLWNLALKANNEITTISSTISAYYALALAKIEGNVVKTEMAQARLNRTMKANPIILIISAVVALGAAYLLFRDKTNNVISSQKLLQKVTKETAVEVAKEKKEVELLIKVAKNDNASKETRIKAIQKLNQISPEYLGGLTLENIQYKKSTDLIKKYTDELYKNARAKVMMKNHDELVEKEANLMNLNSTEYKKENGSALEQINQKIAAVIGKKMPDFNTYNDIEKYVLEQFSKKIGATKTNKGWSVKDKAGFDHLVDNLYNNSGLKSRDREISDTRSKLKTLQEKSEFQEILLEKPTSNYTEDKGSVKESKTIKKDNSSDKEKERRIAIQKEILKAEEDFRKAKNEAVSKYEQEDIDLLKNGFEKEKKQLEFETREKVFQIQEEIRQVQLLQDQFREKATEEDKKGNPEAAEKFRKLADDQLEIISYKNSSILSAEEKGNLELLTLYSKYRNIEIEKRQKASDDLINSIRVKHNEELGEITTIEDAKKVLQEKYGVEQLNHLTTLSDAKNELLRQQNKEILHEQLTSLNTELSEIQRLLDNDAFNRENGLAQILTDEDRDKLIENLKAVGLVISEVKAATSDSKSEDSEENNSRDKAAKSQVLSGIDLLGFSADQWDKAFEGLGAAKTEMEEFAAKIKLVEMAVQSVMAAWGMMSEAQNKALDRNLKKYEAASDRKKKTLKNQLDEGYISESTYNAQVQKLEEDLAAKRAEISYKQAMNEWKMQLVGGMANTALAVTGALGMKPWTPGNIALASIVGGLGLVQTGMIAANKPTKNNFYATGGKTTGLGYKDETGHEVAGTVHANEYVIPEWLRSDPVVARMEEFIESKRNGISQVPSPTLYASGGPVNPVVITNNTPIEQPNNDKLLEDIYEVLIDLKNNGVRLPRTMENAKKIQKDLKDYSDLVSRTQKK